MIKFTRHTLDNGLTVICNTDTSTPFVSVNILYKVGARDEDPNRTGFAHLFEHLMFGGSKHIADYDYHVQKAGGDSNAFTNNDYTNYYITIPAPNIETALWLESDRMLALDFSQKSLDVQRNVVIEEFKQRYFNNPYGDIWLKLRPLAYKVHPYQWPTIGKNIDHIAGASLEEVEDFFHRFYAPDNAILSISGNITDEKALELVKNGSEIFLPSTTREKRYRWNRNKPKSVASCANTTKFRLMRYIKYTIWATGNRIISTRATRSRIYYPTGNPPDYISTSLKTENYFRR